jgi:hypothetical protein
MVPLKATEVLVRIVILLMCALMVPANPATARADEKPADASVRLEIAADKAEYPFRSTIRLTVTYTNTSKETVVLLANGSPSGEGFPGETYEVTSGAGRKTYTVHGVDPAIRKIALEPGKSWKRTLELAEALCNTGVAIDGKALTGIDPLPDPFGRLDDYTVRLSFQPTLPALPKGAINGTLQSNTIKFKVVLR